MDRISISTNNASTYTMCKLSQSTMQHKTLDSKHLDGICTSNPHSGQFITNALHLQQLNTRQTLWNLTYDEIQWFIHFHQVHNLAFHAIIVYW